MASAKNRLLERGRGNQLCSEFINTAQYSRDRSVLNVTCAYSGAVNIRFLSSYWLTFIRYTLNVKAGPKAA